MTMENPDTLTTVSFHDDWLKNHLQTIVTVSAKKQALIMILLLTAVMVFAGIFLNRIVVNYAENNERDHLLAKTKTAASLLDLDSISSLEGLPDDVNKKSYKTLRNQLILIKQANADARFVYLMGKKQGRIVFLADAEPVDSKDYSAPGDVYGEATDELKEIFTSGTNFTEGPVEDRWGTWVSGIVRLQCKNKKIIILGIDIDADKWRKTISVYSWFSIVIAVLVYLIILCFIGIFYQISKKNREIKITNLELEKSRELFDSFMTNLPAYAFIKNAAGEYVYVNKHVDYVAHSSPEMRIGKKDTDVFPSDIADRVIENDEMVFKDNKTIDLIEYIPDTAGKHRTNFVYKFPVKIDAKTVFLGGMAFDITDRIKAEKDRDNFKALLANVTNSIPSALIAIDREMTILHWNREAEKMFGLNSSQAVGSTFADTLSSHQTLVDFVKKAIIQNQPAVLSNRMRYINNESVYEDIAAFPLLDSTFQGMVVRIDDVTHKVKTQRMLIQSEKMLSIGGLAAGMAHEINNPLSGMMLNAQVIYNRLTKKIPANTKAAQNAGITLSSINRYMQNRSILTLLESMHGAGRRMAQIVENMLSFSRKGTADKSIEDLSALLDKTIELSASDYSLKKNYDFKAIKIIREYEDGLPGVHCKAGSIQQVFYNIIKNAAEAMYSQPGEKTSQFIFRLLEENEMVRVEIQDNGPGMEDKIRKRIFEPFFTTKEVDKGTGLGLSISYYIIVDEHAGEMSAESYPGRGTKFIIKLPIEND